MSKYLVTGASGFVGTALVKELAKNGENVIAVVRNENSDVAGISGLSGVKIVYCAMEQIQQLPVLIQDRDIDVCVHLAWDGSTGDARADYEKQLDNVKASVALVEMLHEMQVSRMVCAGTLAELDVQNYHGMDGARPNAVSNYGVAKLTAHYMTKAVAAKYGIEHIWCYLSNTFGEGNRTGNFVNFACKTMLEGRRASFTSAEQMYDFVYIKDTVRALYAVAQKGKAYVSYYLGSTKPRQLKKYIMAMRDAIDATIPVYLGEIPFQGNSLPAEAYDTTKLVEDTGYQPQYTFEDTIGQTIEWLRGEIKE